MPARSSGVAWALMAPLLLVGGCDLVTSSPEDRINAAVALSAEAQTFRRLAVTRTPVDHRLELAEQIGSRLTVRARTCANGYSPSWWASAKTIRERSGDTACFARVDTAFAMWLRLRLVGIALAEGPLAALPSGAIPNLKVDSDIKAIDFARFAGVVALAQLSKVQVVDMNDGKILLNKDTPKPSSSTSPSPNGRLLFLPLDDDLAQIVSVETGESWVDLRGTRAFDWLDDRFALYSDKSRKLNLIDFRAGETTQVAELRDDLRWVAPAPGATGEFILGLDRSFARVKLLPDAAGARLEIVEIADNRFPGNFRVTSGVTVDGKWLFQAATGLVLTSSATFEQERIDRAPPGVRSALPFGADRILLQVSTTPARGGPGPADLVYSISDQTMALVENRALTGKRRAFAASLGKLAYADSTRLVFLDDVATKPAESLESYAATARDGYGGSPPSSGSGVEAANTIDATPGQAAAPLAGLVGDADIEAIGVYEGNDASGPDRKRQTGSVAVKVRRGAKPLVLVLSSYESVRWVLEVEPGARLQAVLVFGYAPSTVQGAGSVRMLMLGSQYAYQPGTPGYAALDREVRRQTGRNMSIFQGRYAGGSFSVGS